MGDYPSAGKHGRNPPTDAAAPCSKARQCTLPDGHDGRHWSAREGFFLLLREQQPGFEFQRKLEEIRCTLCKGKGYIFDSEDECDLTCHRCGGSGLRVPRNHDDDTSVGKDRTHE